MTANDFRFLFWGTVGSALLIAAFAGWALVDNASLNAWVKEDGPVENVTALFFGISSLGFVAIAFRSRFLREKKTGPRYFMVVSWAILMFVFMGEEISWGQRIFGLSTPESLAAINKQEELNIHNVYFVDRFLGGAHRYVSIMMLMTGLVIPTFAATRFGRRVIQWWAFPVCPGAYWLLFVGGYLFGKIMKTMTLDLHDAAEVREFILSVAMLAFALHGAHNPELPFRAGDEAQPERSPKDP